MTKILVIEDESGIRESILEMLQAEDYIVDSAENGQIGLQLIDEFHPDLVICDIMMPVLDGHRVLEQIRQRPATKTLPFIFLTAKTEKTDFRQGMELGASDYITKPFTNDDLLHTIQTRLGLQAAAHEETQKQLDALRTNINTSLPHELSAHLEEIQTLSHTLAQKADTLPTDGIVGLAKGIGRSAEQVSHLVEKLMFSAQLETLAPDESQTVAMRRQSTDQAEQIVSIVAKQIAQDFLREADLELSVEPVAVQMSRAHFRRICQELIGNAFKFSQEGSPVKVVCSEQDHALVFYVIDYGRGMTASNISNIGAYLKFSADSTQQPGLGLGLAIAKKLVELHQGNFLIESIPEKQTIVRITLPVAVNQG
jgi:two-component system sensor histidine kinase/response regulator